MYGHINVCCADFTHVFMIMGRGVKHQKGVTVFEPFFFLVFVMVCSIKESDYDNKKTCGDG